MNNKIIYIICILIGILVGLGIMSLIDKAFAFEQKDIITLYVVTTAEDLTIKWDKHITDPVFEYYYDFHLYNYGEKENYAIGTTQLNQVTMKVPRTGLWVFYCRECDEPKSEEDRECSIYSQSDIIEYAQVKDPVTGLYVPGAWMVYAHIAGITEGEIIH